MTEHAHQLDKSNLTKNQALVYGVLSQSDGPLTAYTILDELRSEGFRAPLQVYRALEKLLAYGLVHRLESLNAFVACSHPDCEEHEPTAFAICEKCGAVMEFSGTEVMTGLKALADSEGFTLHKATIELRGLCKACQSS